MVSGTKTYHSPGTLSFPQWSSPPPCFPVARLLPTYPPHFRGGLPVAHVRSSSTSTCLYPMAQGRNTAEDSNLRTPHSLCPFFFFFSLCNRAGSPHLQLGARPTCCLWLRPVTGYVFGMAPPSQCMQTFFPQIRAILRVPGLSSSLSFVAGRGSPFLLVSCEE